MSDTTNILELPTEPILNNNPNSIQNNTSPNLGNNGNLNSGQVVLDQSTISQIVSGLQQASSTGITQLPSRDLPRNTESIISDPYIQPNFIPNPVQPKQNYIEEEESLETMINQYNKKSNNNDSLDEIYSEIQGPLLLAVLYFLFQLPFFKKFLFQYFSILFNKDGNYNLNGYLFTSILFGIVFYSIGKLSSFLNNF